MAVSRPVVIHFNFEIDQRAYSDQVKGVVKRAKRLGPWLAVLIRMMQLAEQVHLTGGGAFGRVSNLWAAPYSARYAKQKKKKVGHLHKEFSKNKLYDSLTKHTQNSIAAVTSDSVGFGTKAYVTRRGRKFFYPATQQFGAKTKAGTHNKRSGRGKVRKRRPSEKRVALKKRIPPRPPVIENWPDVFVSGMESSLMGYLLDGDLRMPRYR